MNKFLATIGILIFSLITLLTGCGDNNPLTSNIEEATIDFTSLVNSLTALGLNVDIGDEIKQPFFSVTSKVVTVAGEQIQVLEYTTASDADMEAEKISSDGTTIDNDGISTSILWTSKPHFYKKGKIIVIYIGENNTVINALTDILGSQFAGM